MTWTHLTTTIHQEEDMIHHKVREEIKETKH